MGLVRPDLRVAVLGLLHGLRDVENPLARIQVLGTIGLFAPGEGALALLDMATNPTLRPGARLLAADIMCHLHRDYTEKAAVTARGVAHDEAVPWHIRVKAARALARWSELCRAEARALLVELNATSPS